MERDGRTRHKPWLDWMKAEGHFFADDATRARADLRVDGHPSVTHDRHSEVVIGDM
jgi:hypothetical protein